MGGGGGGNNTTRHRLQQRLTKSELTDRLHTPIPPETADCHRPMTFTFMAWLQSGVLLTLPTLKARRSFLQATQSCLLLEADDDDDDDDDEVELHVLGCRLT